MKAGRFTGVPIVQRVCPCGVQFRGQREICIKCRKRQERKEHPERFATKYKENRQAFLARRRLDRYGVTPEKFSRMLAACGGCCEVCRIPFGGPVRRCIDHCHRTGKVRGLLCHKCNTAAGQAGDSPELLRKLAAYLEAKGGE